MRYVEKQKTKSVFFKKKIQISKTKLFTYNICKKLSLITFLNFFLFAILTDIKYEEYNPFIELFEVKTLLEPNNFLYINIPNIHENILENDFNSMNIKIGKKANMDLSNENFNNTTKYTCSRYNRPPNRPIPNSITITLHPLIRLINTYIKNKNNSVTKFKKCECNNFRNYIFDKLTKYKKNINLDNCNYIPQWNYCKYASYTLKYKNFKFQIDKLISKKINITKPKINNNCFMRINVKCLDNKFLRIINEVYAEDFINLNYSKLTNNSFKIYFQYLD